LVDDIIIMNKAEIAIGLIILAAFVITFFYSTPGLGKPWNPHGKPYDNVAYLKGMWLCWIPWIHCVPSPATPPNLTN